MILHVDPDAAVPPYEQLRDQVTTMVLSGQLAPDTRLPPIRQLAADLGLAPGTVARAYRELESTHVVVSRGRHGTFTLAPEARPIAHDRRRRLAEAAEQFAVRSLQLGVTAEDALAAAADALGRPIGSPALAAGSRPGQGTSTTRPNARRSSR